MITGTAVLSRLQDQLDHHHKHQDTGSWRPAPRERLGGRVVGWPSFESDGNWFHALIGGNGRICAIEIFREDGAAWSVPEIPGFDGGAPDQRFDLWLLLRQYEPVQTSIFDLLGAAS